MRERYPAGGSFPTQDQLMRRFGVARATIQQVIAQLVQQGLIEPRRGSGTTVVARPPHRHDYALVFPTSPATTGGELWSRFYAALVNQAAALSQGGEKRVIPFYGMDNGVNASEYPRLLQRVQSHRLAGIIFATPPFRLENTAVLEEPGIPRVALMGSLESRFPRTLAVALGAAHGEIDVSYWEKALEYLAGRGRKRVAVLTLHNITKLLQAIQPLLSARGMSLHPCGLMPFGPVDGARVYVHALMQRRDEARADALIVSDDNLVEPAIAGLIAAGVGIGVELDIVAHCNFPWAGSMVVPVKRLGYDSQTLLRTCIELVDRQHRGEPVPPVTTIKAMFEEELNNQKQMEGHNQLEERKT